MSHKKKPYDKNLYKVLDNGKEIARNLTFENATKLIDRLDPEEDWKDDYKIVPQKS